MRTTVRRSLLSKYCRSVLSTTARSPTSSSSARAVAVVAVDARQGEAAEPGRRRPRDVVRRERAAVDPDQQRPVGLDHVGLVDAGLLDVGAGVARGHVLGGRRRGGRLGAVGGGRRRPPSRRPGGRPSPTRSPGRRCCRRTRRAAGRRSRRPPGRGRVRGSVGVSGAATRRPERWRLVVPAPGSRPRTSRPGQRGRPRRCRRGAAWCGRHGGGTVRGSWVWDGPAGGSVPEA